MVFYNRYSLLILAMIVFFAIGCGSGSSQDTPDIEATVEARVQSELATEATVEARAEDKLVQAIPTPTPVPTPTPKPASAPQITPTPTQTPVPILPSSSSLLKKSKVVMTSLDSFHYDVQMQIKAGDFELPMSYKGRFQAPESIYETLSAKMFGLDITGDFVKIGDSYFEKEFMGEWSTTYEFNGLDPRDFWLEEDNLMDLPIASPPTKIEEQGTELYKISWNLSNMEGELPSSMLSILDISDDDMPDEILVEFWIDTEESYLRKFTVSMEGDANDMDLSEFTGGSDTVTITMELQFFDFNREIEPIVSPIGALPSFPSSKVAPIATPTPIREIIKVVPTSSVPITPTSTPDLGSIQLTLDQFKLDEPHLTLADLPIGSYFLDEDYTDAAVYVDEDDPYSLRWGWKGSYYRQHVLPYQGSEILLVTTIRIYDTVEGANLAIKEREEMLLYDLSESSGYELVGEMITQEVDVLNSPAISIAYTTEYQNDGSQGFYSRVYFARGNILGEVAVYEISSLDVPMEYVVDWAIKQEALLVKELLNPSGGTVFPTPTPTATPMPLGSSRTNPVPIGISVMASNGLVLTVISADNDAWPEIQAANEWNDPPSDGNQYRMFRVKVQNISGDDNNPIDVGEYNFEAVGSFSIKYDTWNASCSWSSIPDSLSVGIFNGATTEGNICFQVPIEESGIVISYNDGSQKYWMATE